MKKLLIITYYWPPSGGSGVQRWLKFSKYLPENGWNPIVYTPDSPSFSIQDIDLMKDVSPETEVWKYPIWEPYTLGGKFFRKNMLSNDGVIQNRSSLTNKLVHWVRGNVFIPDPKIFWVKPSVKLLVKKIKEHQISHIVSTGPPHSMHLIGLGIKKKIPSIRWIADFRDPWSKLDILDNFHLNRRSRSKHLKLEREVLDHADITLTVSENWRSSFEELGAKNVEVITNGFDQEDFTTTPDNYSNDKFVVGHFGLLNHLRNPKQLWFNLNQLCESDAGFNDKLEIRLSGNIDTEVLKYIYQFPHLEKKVLYLGYLSHQEVLMEYHKCSLLLLLLFNSDSGKGNYPGKIFEYFAANKPILAFGPEESDVQKLITETDTGIYLNYNETNNLQEYIMRIFNNKDVVNTSVVKSRFARKNLTSDLSNLLKRI